MAPSLRAIDQVVDLLDRLRLDAAARERGAIVVEGSTDEDFIAEALGGEDVAVFPVSGRNNVFSVADRLSENYLRGVICIADTDFDDEAQQRAGQWFLVFTDNADIEAIAYQSRALDRVLGVWASRAKLNAYGGLPALRKQIINVVRPVSILRRESATQDLDLKFDSINLYDVVDRSALSLNMTGFVDRLARASGLPSSTIANTLDAGSEPRCPHTGAMLMRGRDCLRIIDVALRKVIGTLSHQQVKAGFAEPSVMLAVRASDLRALPFVERLRSALQTAQSA
jgi:hypothetical protein